jgi:hypothetical protein
VELRPRITHRRNDTHVSPAERSASTKARVLKTRVLSDDPFAPAQPSVAV